MIRIFVLLFLLLSSTTYGYPSSQSYSCLYDQSYRNWFVLFYLGKMTNEDLGQVMTFRFTLDQDTLYSIELGKELSPDNPFRRFFQPVVSSIDVRANVTLLDDTYGTIYELNPYFALNWNVFPWFRCLKTTASFGEGFSYVTKIPYAEEHNSDQGKNLLNFLLFELSFAFPKHPEWELVARVHHRSGAFGLYHANNAGSTAFGLALRYRFGC